MESEKIQILAYRPEFAPYFERFNKAWLERWFHVEAVDAYVLENPEEAILNKGGHILFAELDTRIIGTVALKKEEEGVYEMTKMAVDEKYRGLSAGKLLCRAAIEKAREIQAKRLYLYSNTILANAIELYRQMGFREIPAEKNIYARSDIMMEYFFED